MKGRGNIPTSDTAAMAQRQKEMAQRKAERDRITTEAYSRKAARHLMGAKRGDFVHHRDRNPMNNDPANLQIMTREQHRLIHGMLGVRDKGATLDWVMGAWLCL